MEQGSGDGSHFNKSCQTLNYQHSRDKHFFFFLIKGDSEILALLSHYLTTITSMLMMLVPVSEL